MTIHLGNVPTGTTLYIPFHTFNSVGASVTITGLAVTDIEVYKNGSVTQRASDNGYALLDTDGIDFDGLTGIHAFSIDLNDNTDAGFYVAGSMYWVVVSAITVDSQTLSFVVATFFLGPQQSDVRQFGGTAGTFSAGRAEVNTTHAAGTAWNSGAIGPTTLAADTLTAAKVAADVGTEIGTAVWATAARTLTALDEDTTTLDLDATIRAAVGLASANLDTQLDALPTAAENTTAVWAAATRSLTILDEDSTTLDLDATIRAAVGLASANLDTQISTLSGFVDTEVAAILADTNDIQTRLPAALVSGRMDSSVGAMAANVLTAAAINADAFTAAKFAADVTTELQTGLATASALATVQTSVDDLPTNAELATALGNADNAVLAILGTPAGASLSADVAAVKAETASIQTDTNDIQARLPAALVSGRMDASVGAMAANVMTAAAAAADLTTELQSGLATSAALATVDTVVDAIQAKTDNLPTDPADQSLIIAATNALDSHLTTIEGKVDTIDNFVDTEVNAIKTVTDKLDNTVENTSDGYIFTVNALQNAPTGGSAPTASAIADAVWEEAIADHSGTSGSTAEALAAAGGAGDPWITAVPGAYSAGQAGFILGTNLNATVSSRATQSGLDDLPTNAELATALGTADDAVLTAIGDLPTNAELATALGTADDAVLTAIGDLPTNAELATALGTADDAVLAAISTVDTVVDAIKVTTDKLDGMVENTSDGWIWTVLALQNSPLDGAAPSAGAIADAVWDEAVDGSTTARQSVRIHNSFAAGKSSGFDLLQPVFRDLADTKNRIEGELDEFGNRSTVTVDAT